MFGVLHEDRSRAESFGCVAELYDRLEPGHHTLPGGGSVRPAAGKAD
jgi:hypothetical protein